MDSANLETGSQIGLRYMVSYPAAHAQGWQQGRCPVLCFLHGQGEAVPMSLERSAELHGPLSRTSWPAASEQFIIVEPQRRGVRDDWIADSNAVVAIVRKLQHERGGDAARTYLTGFSLGGNGVLDFAAAGPDLWAAFWPVDPTRLPAMTPSRPMWVSAGPLTKRNAGYRAAKASDTGVGAFRVSDEADDHVEAAARAYGRPEVYEWLLAHRL